MPQFCVIGARGFLGSAIAAKLEAMGYDDVLRVRHGEALHASADTGIYCSGLLGSATTNAEEAYRLHVSTPAELSLSRRFKRFVYISSTRVYGSSSDTNDEMPLGADVGSDDFVRTKRLGEDAVRSSGSDSVIIRISNIFGPAFRAKTFLSDVLRQAATSGEVDVQTSRDSSKDYLDVREAAEKISRLAHGSRERTYNVARGRNTTNGEIYDALATLGIRVKMSARSTSRSFQPIVVRRLGEEFGYPTINVIDELPSLLDQFRRNLVSFDPQGRPSFE